MNPREKNLLIVLGAILASGGLLYAGNRWFLSPLTTYNKQIADLSDEVEDKENQQLRFLMERKKLDTARLKSLPAKAEEASSEYREFLTRVLKDNGLTLEEISHKQPLDVKLVTPILGIKKTGHQVMEFTVRARGELDEIIGALEQMQKYPREHRIKTLSIDRVDTSSTKSGASKRLIVLMNIETLLVAKTANRPGSFTALEPKLQALITMPANRKYEKIAEKNIFVGAVPIVIEPPPTVVAKKPKEQPKQKEVEPNVNVPQYVRLSQTVPDQQTAYLRNLIYQSRETKLIAKAQSGYDTFRIIDDDTDYVFFRAKVLRVDARAVHFQIKDEVYTLKMGQTLADARGDALDFLHREDLDLQADPAWAEQETGGKKSSTPKKQTSKPAR